MGKLRFLLALWLGKLSIPALKITHHNGTDFPGSLAVKVCPDFLKYVGKPHLMVAVTGTNGKTTTTYLLKAILEQELGAKVGLVGTNQNLIGSQSLPTQRTTPDAYTLHSLGCCHSYLNRLGICISNILRSQDHNPSCNKFHIFTCIQHLRQIINCSIRIGAAHTLDKCGNHVVIHIFRHGKSFLLYGLLGFPFSYSYNAVLVRMRGERGKFESVERGAHIPRACPCKMRYRLVAHLKIHVAETSFLVVQSAQKSCFNILLGQP